MLLAAGREIEVVLVRRGASRPSIHPDLIEKHHAADLGIRPMLHMRVGTVHRAAAEKAGLKPGDVVLAINGAPADAEAAVEAFRSNAGKPLTMRVRRDGAERARSSTPVAKDGANGRIGVDVRYETTTVRAAGVLDAVRLSYVKNLESAGLVFKSAARPVPRRGVAEAADRLHRHRPGVHDGREAPRRCSRSWRCCR